MLAALNAERTGLMREIVATLQAEQDAIIRSDHHGVLVGRAVMAEVLAAAVRERQAPPGVGVSFAFGTDILHVDPDACARAAAQARASGLPHNQARPFFVNAMRPS
ncbi:hypothetical protein AB0B89_19240 [Sphaerisporangium sp. NPDC049002]|uniref:hypothetical protein n=1 Tax=unclassified Sphaerisporangium TaxID=2630420 RepID=UPI0033E65292